MGTVTNSGTIQKMFVPLPMSTAVYSGGTLQHYRRNDWQGSVRVASTPSKTAYSITAYGAFGETYGASGSPNKQFAGLTSDISSGTEQVSESRRYHPGQGRWISPDSIIPDLFNPQTWNSYAYVMNNPVNNIDPSGLACYPFIEGDCGGSGLQGANYATGGGCDPVGDAACIFTPYTSFFGRGQGFGSDGGGLSFDFGFGLGDSGGSGIWGEWMPPIPTNLGQAIQSIWSDALGLPTLPCATALGPWCNGQGLVSPIMDATAGDCVEGFYKNTKLGKAVEFGSPLGVIPGWNNNWRRNLAEWTILPPAKTLAIWLIKKASAAIGSTSIWSITSGEAVTIAAPTEAAIGVAVKGAGKVAPYALGAATLADIGAHGCNLDQRMIRSLSISP